MGGRSFSENQHQGLKYYLVVSFGVLGTQARITKVGLVTMIKPY